MTNIPSFDSILCIYSSLMVCFNEIIDCPFQGCQCYNGGNNEKASYMSVKCTKFEESVFNGLKNLSSNHQFNIIAFENINIDHFASNSFSDISFRYLIFRNSSLKSITQSTKSIFENVKNKEKTEALTFLNSNITHWNWSQLFKNFNNIKTFYAENCSLPKVINFNNWSRNTLISLSLINCKIEDISEKEFDHWPHLRMVSLARNSIKALKSCWFSVKFPELWSLDLSYNKISTIDREFFLKMPALRRLRLDNNELKNLNWNNWNNFGHISGSLREFTFESNNIDCTEFCRIKLSWSFSEIPKFFFCGNCKQQSLVGKSGKTIDVNLLNFTKFCH